MLQKRASWAFLLPQLAHSRIAGVYVWLILDLALGVRGSRGRRAVTVADRLPRAPGAAQTCLAQPGGSQRDAEVIAAADAAAWACS